MRHVWGMGDCDAVFENVSLGGFSNFIGKRIFASHALHDEDYVFRIRLPDSVLIRTQ